MQSGAVSIENQKRALQIKYLLHLPNEQNQQDLLNALNKIYPFTQYPLNAVPPVEMIETDSEDLITDNFTAQISKYSYLVLTGGMNIQKKQHRYMENRYVGPGIQDDVFFNVNEGEVTLWTMRGSCYLRVHNIWIEKAKKKHKMDMEEYIKKKLLDIPFFSNLTFKEFQKCFKTAYVNILGPGDVLLEAGATPYHMYIVAEGELVFEKKVKFLKDQQLWLDVKNELQRSEDNTCEEMFNYLIKQPKKHEPFFEIVFKIKNVGEKEIICAKETLCEEALTYSILSSLKTKIICIKYPDLYNLEGDRLTQIRTWPTFGRENSELRKDYYYQNKWSEFKEQTKRQSHLGTMQKQKFEDFLRKDVDLNQDKTYYCPNKIGEGSIIGSPAGKVSKLKTMSYTTQFQT